MANILATTKINLQKQVFSIFISLKTQHNKFYPNQYLLL